MSSTKMAIKDHWQITKGLYDKGGANKRVHLTAIPLRPSGLLHVGK